MIKENRIYFGKDSEGAPQVKRYLNEVKDGVTPMSIWLREEVGDNQDAKYELNNFFDIPTFDTPKPTSLVKRIINLSTLKFDNELIIDFFAGSGTTAQAVYELNKEDGGNRKFILVQLPEKTEEDSEAFKAGYKTIADISKERIRRVIKKIDKEIKNEQLNLDKGQNRDLDLGFKVFKLKNSNFKLWRGDGIENEDELNKQLSVFEDPVKDGADDENIVYELMLKMGLDLNLNVEGHEINADSELTGNKEKDSKAVFGFFRYFKIDGGRIIIFTEAEGSILNFMDDLLESEKPEKIICLDRIFEGDDESKTNLVLQMRDAGVEFKTV